MSHDELKALVADLAIGALDAAEARRVEAHVAGCPECAAELASLTGTASLLRALPPIPASSAGEASLLDGARRAAERMAAERRPVRRVPRWLLGLALGGAGAAAALLVTLQVGRPPASTFDQGRDALDGSGSAPAAAAPEPSRAPPSAGVGGAAPLGVAAPSAATPAAPERERLAKAVATSSAAPPPAPPARRAAKPAQSAAADLAETAAPDAAREAARDEAKAAPAPEPRAMAKGEAAAGAPGAAVPEVRDQPGCSGEVRRTLWREAGRVVRRERRGTLGGVAYQLTEAFDAAGRLSSAMLVTGGRTVTSDGPGVAAGRLAGLVPGLEVARDAAAAEATPPRCAP